jgi:hypothetical protein
MNMQEKNDYRFLAGAALLSFSLHAGAAGEGRAEIDAWLNLEPTELPTPGTTITQAEIELVRPLLPPGFIDHVNHPALSLEIQATADYPPHESYLAATAAHAGQASLKAEGGMEGFTAGRPFDPQTFDDVSPEEAGMMIAWNHVYRWQYYGYKLDTLDMTYVQATADGSGGASDQGMEGGGSIERHLVQSYHRVYLNHLAMLPQQDWKVNAGGSDKRYFKDYISFLEPFDVQGTTFVVERALDPNEEDQVNSYLPSQRRVRRLSAEERADSFMGSNFTLDDFEGFSGRVMDYHWTWLGQKTVLHVADSRHERLRFNGPQSNVAVDRWQARPCFVVELKPRWEGHPMSAKILLVDQQTWSPTMALVFNREGKLWRYIQPHYQRPVSDTSTPERAMETSVGHWRGSIAIDFVLNSTTLARATSPTETPTMTDKEIKRRFSLSTLTEGR